MTQPDKPIPLRLTRPLLGDEELQAVREVFDDGWLTGGPRVEAFEQTVAGLAGTEHGVAVSSGTAALHLCLMSLGLDSGDEVIIPDYSFPATANAVVAAGAIPVFSDVDPLTFNMDPEGLPGLLTHQTRAIIPVHQFGQPADMDPILDLARAQDVAVLEDAACALGARYGMKDCGSIGFAGCFSFHPRKIVTTAEGGLVATNDSELAERIRLIRNQGMFRKRAGAEFVLPGLNYRMSDVHAAIGNAQLAKLSDQLSRRRTLANWYREALSGVTALRVPHQAKGTRHSWQSFVVVLGEAVDRTTLIWRLSERGIETAPPAPATHRTEAFLNYRPRTDLTVSVHLRDTALALPFHPAMTENDVDRVAAELKKFLG